MIRCNFVLHFLNLLQIWWYKSTSLHSFWKLFSPIIFHNFLIDPYFYFWHVSCWMLQDQYWLSFNRPHLSRWYLRTIFLSYSFFLGDLMPTISITGIAAGIIIFVQMKCYVYAHLHVLLIGSRQVAIILETTCWHSFTWMKIYASRVKFSLHVPEWFSAILCLHWRK